MRATPAKRSVTVRRPAHRSHDLEVPRLAIGSHAESGGEMCAMEAVAWLAGEPWSDHPRCSSEVIGALLRALNDSSPDEDRQAFVAVLPSVVGTAADTAAETSRSWMVLSWHARDVTAAWLTLIGLDAEAGELVSADPVRDTATLHALIHPLRRARASAEASNRNVLGKALEGGWLRACEAAAVSPNDPAVAVARDESSRAPNVSLATLAASRAIPTSAGWDCNRTAAWHAAWEDGWIAASAVDAAVHPAVVRAQALTAAWDARWDLARDLDPEAWDTVLELSRSAARQAAVAASWRSAWIAVFAHGPIAPDLVDVTAAAAVAAALAPTARALQTGVLSLVRNLAEANGADEKGGRVRVQR